MSVIPIETAMKHCRADDDDQELVQAYLDAAEDHAAQFLNRTFHADADRMAIAILDGVAGDDPILINPSITAACLLIAGHLYLNREDSVAGVSIVELPRGSKHLLFPYRVGMGI